MKHISEILKKYHNLNIIIKASIWFTICSFIQKGISIVTMPIFTRLLTTSEYGNYSIYISWLQIFIIFITLNIHKEIFNKGLIEHNEQQDEYMVNQMGLLITLGTIFLILIILFNNIINALTGLTIVLSVFLVFEVISNSIISLWYAKKRFNYEYKKIVIVTILMSILNPIIGLILVNLSNYKVEARIVSNISIPIILSIMLLLIYSKRGNYFSNFRWWKKSILAGIPLVPHYISLVLLNQVDKLMINKFYGSSFAAIYSIAHTAGLLMVLVNEALNNSFVPLLYRKLKSNKSNELKKIIKPLLYIVAIANLFLIWIAPECVNILATSEYKEAIWCIVPIAVSGYCTFIYTLFVDVEIYYNGNGYVTIGSVIAAILNVVLNYIYIPKYGFIAAAYTTLISYFITMVVHYIFMKHMLSKNEKKQDIFDVKEIIMVFILLIIFSIIALVTYKFFFIRYIIIIVMVIIVIYKRNNIIKIFKQMKK